MARGYGVLFIDLDGQGNLSHTMKAGHTELTSLDVLMGNATAREAIRHTEDGDIMGSSPSLAGADTLLTATGKEYRLKESLKNLDYDYAIIDTPPALGVITINALTASAGVIIPAQADTYSLQGISQLNDTLTVVKRYCNPSLNVLGILLTRYNQRAILSRDIAKIIDQTAEQLNTKLYATKIRECVALREAQANQRDIFSYAPRSNAAEDYMNFLNEFLNKETTNDKKF
jgi:chromosome partitioning protein